MPNNTELPALPVAAMRAAPLDKPDWPFPTVGYYTADQMAEYARAALAAAPQAAQAGEPVAWAIFDSQGFYEAALDEDSAKRFCDHHNKRPVDPLKPYTYGPLYRASPQAERPALPDVDRLDADRWRALEEAVDAGRASVTTFTEMDSGNPVDGVTINNAGDMQDWADEALAGTTTPEGS